MSGDPSTTLLPYPQIYRSSGSWLIGLTFCGFAMSIGGGVGAYFFATASLRTPQLRLWLIGICLCFAVFGVYCLLYLFRFKVALFPDRIEVEGVTRTVVLGRDEIRGWRLVPASPPILLLEPRDAGHRAVKVTQLFHPDTAFEEWVYTLPSLDRQAARASKAEIRNDIRLGATPGERVRNVAKAKRVAWIAGAMGVVLMLWGFFWPRPYEFAILGLGLSPWIALELVRRSKGLFRIDSSRNDAHPTIASLYLFPSMVLMFRAVDDFNIMPSVAAALLSIGVGGLLFLATLRIDPSLKGKLGTKIALAVFSLAYGYGAGIEMNTMLDRSTPVTYAVPIKGKRVIDYKGKRYELQLGPWGPKTKPSELRVGRATYEPIQSGDVVILALKRGALGVKWFYIQAWQHGDVR